MRHFVVIRSPVSDISKLLEALVAAGMDCGTQVSVLQLPKQGAAWTQVRQVPAPVTPRGLVELLNPNQVAINVIAFAEGTLAASHDDQYVVGCHGNLSDRDLDPELDPTKTTEQVLADYCATIAWTRKLSTRPKESIEPSRQGAPKGALAEQVVSATSLDLAPRLGRLFHTKDFAAVIVRPAHRHVDVVRFSPECPIYSTKGGEAISSSGVLVGTYIGTHDPPAFTSSQLYHRYFLRLPTS